MKNYNFNPILITSSIMQWPTERYTITPQKQTKPNKQEDKIHIYFNRITFSSGYMIQHDTIQLYCHTTVIVITEIHYLEALLQKIKNKKQHTG